MFFTPELLAKRDSGFGLLWLAATLGSKSAFKKLPKRSVLTADIAQLCDLISQPAEPLALRLSSNLMFGVVRVYKVKQEIFLADVTNCVTSLKKVVQDLRSTAAQEGQLQMANPMARPSTLTMVPNPRAAHALDYDALVVDWDEYLNIAGNSAGWHRRTDLRKSRFTDSNFSSVPMIDDGDDDFDPTQKKKKRSKVAQIDSAATETVRKETHTLDEHHEHVLSASCDLSFTGSACEAGIDPSSSQVDVPAFDNFFLDGLDAGDGLGLGLGEDLARELGWAVSPVKSVRGSERHSDLNFDNINDHPAAEMDFNFPADEFGMAMDIDQAPIAPDERVAGTPRASATPKKQKTPKKENRILPTSRAGSVHCQIRVLSPVTSFSQQLLSQGGEESFQPLRDITSKERNRENRTESSKKLKRTRLLLDARTELTDDELKVARAKYLQLQKHQRRELLQKKLEKESGRVIEEMIWGAPKGMQAQELINFWQENFKVQVETRSGVLRIHEGDDYELLRPKRRRIERRNEQTEEFAEAFPANGQVQTDTNMDMPMSLGFDNADIGMPMDHTGGFRHSSEEPGQARRWSSRSGSVVAANLGFDLGDIDVNRSSGVSQRSSLFPWDNAGPSSSSGNDPAVDVAPAVESVDVKLRSNSSISRRESSLAPSQRGSITGGLTFSPRVGIGGSQLMGEDFAFDVENPNVGEDTQQDTQKSDLNLVALEKNSYNFLEYAKMQQRSLPRLDDHLDFDAVAPKATSTRHVAAAAFYHCLVLATKNLIRLEQPAPYSPVLIIIK